MVKRELDSISQDLLPAILLLHGERACLLLKKDGGKYVVSHPELGGSSMEMEPAELAAQYTGVVCFVRPQFRFDARAPEVAKVRERHWFWAAIMENRRSYRDALVAALLINVFAMAMPLFTMNVYDRVVPNNAVETLWVLAIGITLVVIFNMILSTARSHVVDSASKRVDVRLSAQIMERVLDLRLEGRPVSVGSFRRQPALFRIHPRLHRLGHDHHAGRPALHPAVPAGPGLDLPLDDSAAAGRHRADPAGVAGGAGPYGIADDGDVPGLVAAQRDPGRGADRPEAVKTLNAQGSIQRNWERATEFIAQTGGKLKLISSSTVGFVQAVQQMVSISVVIIGVYQAQESAISMGGIIAASMIADASRPGAVAACWMQYQNARTSLGSIDNYMKLPVERPAEAEFLHRPVFHGGIEFRDVTPGFGPAPQLR